MWLVEPGKRPRRMPLFDAGAIEDACKMAEILEAVGKQPGRGFDRLFWKMTCSGVATARLTSLTVSVTEFSLSLRRNEGKHADAQIIQL